VTAPLFMILLALWFRKNNRESNFAVKTALQLQHDA